MSTPAGGPSYLGIDLGTSGLKLALVGTDGSVVAEAEESYAVQSPRPGWAETDPLDWEAALERALNRLAPTRALPVEPTAVGFSGQMHGVVLSSDAGEPLRPALLWPDQRAATVMGRWQALAPQVRGSLANPLVPGMAGPLLTWLAEHEPAVLDAAVVASPKDWLRRRLLGGLGSDLLSDSVSGAGGDRVGDRSDASATLMWDLVADDWSDPAVSLAGIARERLPVMAASSSIVGETSVLAKRGLATGEVPVVTGAGDTAAALIGLASSGAVPAGSVVVNAGTGIQILRTGVHPNSRVGPLTHLYCDASGGWYEMLAIQNGGYALTWAQRQLSASWDSAVALASAVPPGSRGAMFLPFLTGERGGVAPASASAGWRSLTTSTERPEMLRAAFEAYAFTVRRGLEVLGSPAGPLVLSGGGGRGPWLRQLLADVLGRPVSYVALRSASAVGAAALAARGVNVELDVPATIVRTNPSGPAVQDGLDEAYVRWAHELQAR